MICCFDSQQAPVSEKCGCGNSPNPLFQLNPSSSTIRKMLSVSASERSFVETKMNHIFAVHCETLFNPFVLLVTFQEYDASHTHRPPFSLSPESPLPRSQQPSRCLQAPLALTFHIPRKPSHFWSSRPGVAYLHHRPIRSALPPLDSKPLRALPVS